MNQYFLPRRRLRAVLILSSLLIGLLAFSSSIALAQTPGDIIITEIMQNPSAVSDSNGEYFEVYNTSGSVVDMNGWTVADNDFDSFIIGGALNIAPGTYLVFSNNADSGTNGGVTVDYEYSGMFLSNGADEVALFDTVMTEIDRVEYDGGSAFPDPTGASMSLSDLALDNNVGASWCEATTSFGAGDKGTPGTVNNCDVAPPPPPSPADIIITEIMQNPSAVSDSSGEYFEVYNAGSSVVDMDGWTIKDDGSNSHIINNGSPLNIAPSSYLVFSNNADSGTNGGITVDYQYASMFLGNSDDEVVLLDAGLNEIDRVNYDNGASFPDPTGASMSLSDLALDNNVGANWCTSVTAFGSGDLGTPGSANICVPPPPVATNILINEVDADTPGTDVAEFVELYDGGTGNIALDGLVLVLYNGSDNKSYEAFDLDGQSTDADGFFVLCENASNVANCGFVTGTSSSFGLIQNGADAVALFVGNASDFPNDTALTTAGLIDALVYDTNDSDDAGILPLLNAGQAQINEDGSGDKDNHSNQRCANGSGGARNTDTYGQFTPSPGTANCFIDALVTINPINPNGWGFLLEPVTASATGNFVAGPGTPLQGDGSVEFTLGDNSSGVIFGTQQFAGVRLDEISELSYSTYNTVGNGTVAPALQFNIDYDLTDGNVGWQGRLVFEPYFSGVPVVDGTWQTWDTLAGNWWSTTSNPVVGDASVAQSCSQASTCDLATLLSLYPNAGVQTGGLSGVLFKAGSGWFAGYQGSVDNFVIQVNNERTTFDFEPFILTLIHTIQGSADVSPLDGTTVNVRAVVVGDFQETNELSGFVIQEEDADADGDAQTSEGIFVYCGGGASCPDVSIGNIVTVTGNVDENNNQTQLDNDSGNLSVVIDDAGNNLALATPAQISFPVANVSDLEAVESMSVQVVTGMHAVEYFNFDRFSEIRVWNDGSGADRPYQFTQNNLPDVAGSQAAQDSFNRSSIILDDASGVQNDDKVFPQHANFPIFGDNSFNPGNPSAGFRGGDLFSNIEGVMAYSFNQYRIHISDLSTGTAPDGAPFDITISNTNPRSASPDDVGGNITVASFNVLNYFTTIDTGANICGGNANLGCRGADSASELARQQDKLVQALAALDTDIVGLIEIENTLGVSAEQTLVTALNLVSSRTYNYINTGTIGTDAIKVALIYDVNTISPVGNFAILDSSIDPTFIDTKNRPVLIQTFAENATASAFTVAVNHFKSKGSSCASIGDPNTVNGQGNCNGTRTAAAIALANYLATDPTNSGDADFLIIGDLNSYAMEDPITALSAAGYTDLVQSFNGSSAYGYVFSGQWGTLDYALANSTLASQVTGVTEWHINADEPDILDYDERYNDSTWYQADGFRASDHDPVIIGFDLEAAPTATLVDISPAPLFAGENGTLAFINVSDPNDPGLVDSYTYAIDCTTDGTPDAVVDGAGTGVTLPCSYPGAGTYGATGMIRDETGLISNTNMVVITVITTEDAFAVVQTYIDGMDGLNNGQRNALGNHLTNALRQYSRANINPTLAQLNALYDQVQDFAMDGIISETVRMELSDLVLRLIVSVTS